MWAALPGTVPTIRCRARGDTRTAGGGVTSRARANLRGFMRRIHEVARRYCSAPIYHAGAARLGLLRGDARSTRGIPPAEIMRTVTPRAALI